MASYQAFEKALGDCPIPLGLEKHINHFHVLIDSPPQVMLLANNLHEDFIDVEGVAVSPVLALQSPDV